MRLGCFGFSKDLKAISEAGFDFAELDIMELSRMSDPEFDEFVCRAKDTGLGFDAFSGFMPLTERIHAPEFDMRKWWEHARFMFGRIQRMGAKMMPIGAGKCRSIPDGTDPERCADRVRLFFGEIAGIAADFGIRVCIEPLGPANSNFLNLIGETAEFARSTGVGNCYTMCDMRHMVKLDEPWEDILRWKEHIIHAHIDYPLGDERRFPAPDDGYDYRPYLRMLRQSGYDGPLTVEATVCDDLRTEGGICAEYLRKMLGEL